MENENIKKVIKELTNRLGETILEETEWRILTNMATYNIDTNQSSIFIMRIDKNKEEFPLLSISDKGTYAWDEKGWHVIIQTENYEDLFPVIINSWREFIDNKNELLYSNIKIPFSEIPKNTRKQLYPLSENLNTITKGMLNDELFPNPQSSHCDNMSILEKDYFYENYYENWKISERNCIEKKWGEVLEGLQREEFYILKEELFDTLNIIKKGFQKRYILTRNLPYTFLSEKENITKVSKFIESKNLQKECGKYFDQKKLGKEKEIKFKSIYNDKYFRMSKGLLFSTDSMAYTVWDYEGFLTDEQIKLFKLVEQK